MYQQEYPQFFRRNDIIFYAKLRAYACQYRPTLVLFLCLEVLKYRPRKQNFPQEALFALIVSEMMELIVPELRGLESNNGRHSEVQLC